MVFNLTALALLFNLCRFYCYRRSVTGLHRLGIFLDFILWQPAIADVLLPQSELASESTGKRQRGAVGVQSATATAHTLAACPLNLQNDHQLSAVAPLGEFARIFLQWREHVR